MSPRAASLLTVLAIASTGGWQRWENAKADVAKTTGVHKLFVDLGAERLWVK